MKLTIGTDPEVFLYCGGKPVSAHGVIPGTKRRPHKVDGGAVQVDGMALEFNTIPSSTYEGFAISIDKVLGELKKMIPEGHDLRFNSVASFGAEYIEAQPNEAKALGCDPDFDAYIEGPNDPPDASSSFRTAAGHVHLGWTKGVDPFDPDHFINCCILARQLDWYLGMPSVILDPAGVHRRQLYGKAGTFRPKSYGMEYRTLSNFWLAKPELIAWVFGSATLAFRVLTVEKRFLDAKVKYNSGYARDLINGAETADAYSIRNCMQIHKIPMPRGVRF
jgi:hypothetical protein